MTKGNFVSSATGSIYPEDGKLCDDSMLDHSMLEQAFDSMTLLPSKENFEN